MRGGGPKATKQATAVTTAPIVRGWMPFWAEAACAVIGLFFIVVQVSAQTKKDPIGPHLPPLLQHFLQAAGLFPNAAEMVIDYRLEAWSCPDKAFVETDTRPYFPMRPDDKENRFFRMAQFYHSAPKVLGAFDDWFSERNHTGGIRLYSLRLPIPTDMQPYARTPLAELPDSVKKVWYQTTVPERERRCAAMAAAR